MYTRGAAGLKISNFGLVFGIILLMVLLIGLAVYFLAEMKGEPIFNPRLGVIIPNMVKISFILLFLTDLIFIIWAIKENREP